MKEYSSIHYMWHFTTKNWVIFFTPRCCGLSLPRTLKNSLEGSRYNESGLYIFQKHLYCTQVKLECNINDTIKFQHERSTNCGQKSFFLQRRRIEIPPPLLNKLPITAITADCRYSFYNPVWREVL